MKRFIVIFALVAFSAWAFTRPAVRSRVDALRAKAAGVRPEASWAQTFVSLAPISWRPGIRLGLLKLVDSLDAAAVSPILWSRSLDLPADPGEGLTLHTLFVEPTACMRMLNVHLSILPAGQTPHPIHRHEEEELIILLSGEVEIVRADPDGAERTTVDPLGPGSIIYHPSGLPHTIKGGQDDLARYLVFKWRADKARDDERALRQQLYELSEAQQQLVKRDRDFGSELIFESPTLFLKRLHAHASRARPGAGYPDERDPYDIALVLFSGRVVTQGREVAAPAIVYYPADEPHDLLSSGDQAAEYVIIEFHGHAELNSL